MPTQSKLSENLYKVSDLWAILLLKHTTEQTQAKTLSPFCLQQHPINRIYDVGVIWHHWWVLKNFLWCLARAVLAPWFAEVLISFPKHQLVFKASLQQLGQIQSRELKGRNWNDWTLNHSAREVGLRFNTKLRGGKCFCDCEVLPTCCISSLSSVPGPIVPDLRMSNLQKKVQFLGEKKFYVWNWRSWWVQGACYVCR